MSEAQRNVEAARAGLDAYSRGDMEAFLSRLDPQVEVFSTPELPNPGTFSGREGYLQWTSQWLDAWESFEVEALAVEAVGERHVLMPVRQHGIGKGSGIPVEMAACYMLEYRDGLATRLHLYVDRKQALEAAWAAEGMA